MIGRRALVGGIIGAGMSGGLGAPRHDQHYEPPEGGQVVPGARSVVRAQKVIIVGKGPPAAGLFVYSPTVSFGHLIDSIAALNGTDGPPGNAVIQGIANYVNSGVNQQAVVFQNAQLVLYKAPNAGGPWTVQALINQAAGAMNIEAITGNLVLSALGGFDIVAQSPVITNSTGSEISAPGLGSSPLLTLNNTATNLGNSESLAFIAIAAGDRVSGIQVFGDTFDRLSIGGDGTHVWGSGSAAGDTTLGRIGGVGLNVEIGTNNATALGISNTGTNGGKPLVQLTTSVAADRALGIQAAADTSERIRIDSVPQILMGSGSAAGDCTFARAAPGEFFSDGIAAKISGAAEVWNAATFANGWTNAATGPNLQYRKVAAPYNSIQWVGRIVAPAGVVLGQAITAAPVAAYHPANFGDIIAWDATSNATVLLRVGTGGALLLQAGVVAAADVITIPVALVSLDA